MNDLKKYFSDNKYTNLYFDIIENAKSKDRIKRRTTHKQYVYYEKHHILPESTYKEYSNLSDYEWNGVLLTPREHFLCHYLLCKMVDMKSESWHSYVRAFTFMYSSSDNQNRYFNSKLYERARKNIGLVMSEAQSGEKNSQYGTCWVSNIEKRDCIRIDSNELDYYIDKGYIKKRIIKWDVYDNKIISKKESYNKRLLNKLETINIKILNLEKEKEELVKEIKGL